MRKLLVIALAVVTLVGCSGRNLDDAGKSHANGVVYFDDAGNLQHANSERISPESQDNWQTVGAVVGAAATIAGLAVGIVSLTK